MDEEVMNETTSQEGEENIPTDPSNIDVETSTTEEPETPVEEDTKKTTSFTAVYNSFLGKITDDMYVELTPEDTVRDLQSLLLEAIPGFEFPRCLITDYTITTEIKKRSELADDDFVIGVIWHELDDMLVENDLSSEEDMDQLVRVEKSCFNCDMTSEEINILAILMMCAWVQRQVTSIEVTRMKYSGSDFKMTSQANHLSKLLALLSESQRQSHKMQRLYKRRRIIDDENNPFNGFYRSNWDVFGQGVYYDRYNG